MRLKVLQLGKREVILLCLGLVLAVAIAIVEPGVLLGLVVGFGAGAFCYKSYPRKFRWFTLPKDTQKARIKELETQVRELTKTHE